MGMGRPRPIMPRGDCEAARAIVRARDGSSAAAMAAAIEPASCGSHHRDVVVAEIFGERRDARRHHRHTACHRFQHDEAEALLDRGKHQVSRRDRAPASAPAAAARFGSRRRPGRPLCGERCRKLGLVGVMVEQRSAARDHQPRRRMPAWSRRKASRIRIVFLRFSTPPMARNIFAPAGTLEARRAMPRPSRPPPAKTDRVDAIADQMAASTELRARASRATAG